MRKIIALDIDGTLISSNHEPLDSTYEAVKRLQEQGHYVTIATGRTRMMAEELIQKVGLTNYILCNGAAAFMDHQQVYKNLLPTERLDQLVKEAAEMPIETAFIGLDGVKRYMKDFRPEVVEAMSFFGDNYVPEWEADFHLKNEVYQGLAFYDQSVDGTFEKEFPEFRFVRWHPYSVDIVPKEGSKAITLMTLAERLGVPQADVIAIGDGENDKEMLQAAGVGIAMGNASDSVKSVANMVTASNDEDGIWQALRKLDLI